MGVRQFRCLASGSGCGGPRATGGGAGAAIVRLGRGGRRGEAAAGAPLRRAPRFAPVAGDCGRERPGAEPSAGGAGAEDWSGRAVRPGYPGRVRGAGGTCRPRRAGRGGRGSRLFRRSTARSGRSAVPRGGFGRPAPPCPARRTGARRRAARRGVEGWGRGCSRGIVNTTNGNRARGFFRVRECRSIPGSRPGDDERIRIAPRRLPRGYTRRRSLGLAISSRPIEIENSAMNRMPTTMIGASHHHHQPLITAPVKFTQ
jgi:hypothetical protein